MVRSRWSGVLGAAVALLGSTTLLASGAGAAHAGTPTPPPSVFASWGEDLGNAPGDYVAKPRMDVSKDVPVSGFPQAGVVSDSARTASVPTGLSTWWGSQTPPGRAWGSSEERGFLSIRPASDAPGTPSTTTITFTGAPESGTAPSVAAPRGWGFVVGDVDSETVTVSGIKADGQAADAHDLGFAGTFNACATRERMLSCPKVAGAAPRWDATAQTLTGTAADSIGADAWFVPTARLQSLTLTSTATSGSPVFQTWMVTRTHVLSGVVRVGSGSCDVTKAKVLLVDPEGHQAGKPVDVRADGSWTFGATVAGGDLSARLDASGVPGCEASSQVKVPVSLARGDARVGFTLAQTQGLDVTGSVVDDENDPVKGATVTLRVGSVVRSATTGAGGAFTLTRVPPNVSTTDEAYAVSLTPPAGLQQVGTRPASVRLLVGRPVDRLDYVVEGTRLTDQSSDPVAAAPGGGSAGTGGVTGPVGPVTTTSGTPVSTASSGGTYSAAGAYTSATTSPVVSSLPDTGGPQRLLLTAGLGLVLAGGATLLVDRRRRRA